MKRDLKINFYILEEIISEVRKYKSALEEMERASSKMIRLLEESEAEAIEKLEKIYNGFSTEVKKCYTELEDLETILSNYTNEMQAIIKPNDIYRFMRVDRNDIWFNMQSIISACQSISHLNMNHAYIGMSGWGFGKSEEEKHREEQNYRKLEDIWYDLIPKYSRKLNVHIDALNDVYNRKIVPFENKDDEYGNKASRLCHKYTSFWERIRADFKDDIKVIIDLVRGAGTAIIDLVGGLVGLAGGIISYTSSAVVLAVTYPFNAKPRWAEEIFNGTNTVIGSILNDPMLIVEGLSQQVSDTFEEDGAAYCIGYVAGDFLGAKGLDKLVSVGRTKLIKKGKVAEDIGDVPKVVDNTTDDVLKAVDDVDNVLKGGLKSEVEIVDELSNSILNKAKTIEPEVTKTMQTLEIDGAHLKGLDYRLKSKESLSRKIFLDSHVKGISLDEAASEIRDSLRYTLVADEVNYSNVVEKSLKQLQSQGYTINKVKNSWGDDLYQGINVSLTSPKGVKMELQFHTEASYYTKEVLNHSYYEIVRSETSSIEEIVKANEIMIENQAKVSIPKGAENITGIKGG